MSIFDRIGTVVSGRSTRVLLVIAAAVTLGACDTVSNLNPFDKGSTYKPEIIPEIPAERLYNDGLALIERKEFEAASEKFRTIDKQFPFSDWARKALLMETFANFSRTNYDETVVSGKRYLSLYPASPDAAYAAYMVANAYYNAVPDVTRDQERHQSGGAVAGAQPVDDDAGDRDRQPVSGIGQAADHTPGRTEIGGVGHGFGKNPADENAAHQRPLGSGPAGVVAAGEKTGGGARARRDRIHRAAVEQQEAPEINCECRFDHLLLFAFSLPARRRSSNPGRRCSRNNDP